MKIKTSKLKGTALDYAVAVCEGISPKLFEDTGITWVLDDSNNELNYSQDWSQAGPIIERELIMLEYDCFSKQWCSRRRVDDCYQYGCTPLKAAMRCYVASKVGDEIEIPEELV